ncbi:hypothetical protein NQZ68_013596 [Dissostichus eleginoides]|nr:hypothetical protein NQZ68_013596 [Dissostichus eleginoides]
MASSRLLQKGSGNLHKQKERCVTILIGETSIICPRDGSSRQPLVQLPQIFPACIANTLPRALPAPDISVGMPMLLLCQSQ